MKIAVVQLNSVDNFTTNLDCILNVLKALVDHQPRVVFFPENSLYLRIDPKSDINYLDEENMALELLQNFCSSHQLAVHLTTPTKKGSTRSNTSFLIERDGSIKILYRKIHLFDVDVRGVSSLRESDSFDAGSEPNIFYIDNFKFGSSICYDIRFSELYSHYAAHEVDALVVPAAFLVPTGRAHWEALLRARAIESQCYVIAPAQAGTHISSQGNGAQRESYGHSMVVEPWGRVAFCLNDETIAEVFEIQKQSILEFRQQIPMHKHRRLVLTK